jgi:RHS repeat-associated protein
MSSSAAGNATTFEYYHRDHLNSVEVVSGGDGVSANPKSFDSYGRPRLLDWTSLDPFAIQSQSDSRGYTGHEHIDETGLIHMNGRVYNPILGRFISADPTIQFAKVQQSYNRYSYVANNPLKYTDPTGYEIRVRESLAELFKETEIEKKQLQDEK